MERKRLLIEGRQRSVDWIRHTATWAGCQKCPIGKTTGKYVFARGELPCDVLFVGEGPGSVENALGFPFVGPSGKLLDELIEIGVRDHSENVEDRLGRPVRAAFANLLACTPWLDRAAGTVRAPSFSEIENCAPRLVQLLALAAPTVIVAVGSVAKETLDAMSATEKYSLGSIVHPAYILRQDTIQAELDKNKTALYIGALLGGQLAVRQTAKSVSPKQQKKRGKV